MVWPDGVCRDRVSLQRVDWLLMAAQRALLQLIQASWDGDLTCLVVEEKSMCLCCAITGSFGWLQTFLQRMDALELLVESS